MSLSEIFRSVSLTLKKKKKSKALKKRFYEAHERVRNTAEEAKRDSGSFLFLFSLSVSTLSVLRHPPKSPRFRRCFSLACPPCTPLLSLRTQLFVCLPSAVETQELQHLGKKNKKKQQVKIGPSEMSTWQSRGLVMTGAQHLLRLN